MSQSIEASPSLSAGQFFDASDIATLNATNNLLPTDSLFQQNHVDANEWELLLLQHGINLPVGIYTLRAFSTDGKVESTKIVLR